MSTDFFMKNLMPSVPHLFSKIPSTTHVLGIFLGLIQEEERIDLSLRNLPSNKRNMRIV